MKIIDTSSIPSLVLSDLSIGDVFYLTEDTEVRNKRLFMLVKEPNTFDNSVILNNGVIYDLPLDTLVTPMKTVIKVEGCDNERINEIKGGKIKN